ncbi:MAG: methyltransferase [Candidatus Omnitrophota bacterium]|jgi:hypothetical protein|nr:MAG: methyltransferase [Candidatus Omnitrophota bacterium]
MTSRERILAAIRHRNPDKIPIDFGGCNTTGMHVSCVAALRDYYGLENRPVKVHEPGQMLGWIDDDLKEAMGIDTECVFPRGTGYGYVNENWKLWRMPDGLEVLVGEGFQTTKDAQGNTYLYPQGDTSAPPSGKMPKDGYFFDVIVRQEAFDENRLNPDDNLEEFQPITEEELAYWKSAVQEAASKGRAVFASFGGTSFGDIARVPAASLKHPKGIRDISEWYMSIVLRPDYLHAVFSKQCDIALANLERIHAVVGDAVDVAYICGTDFGAQNSSFCSTETFRELYKPYYVRVNDWIHNHTQWKCFKHSCGAVEKFLEDFIDAGFDIFNPVQCSAMGMDAAALKSNYGDRITFWGGGVDTQRILPFATPAEVREQVLRRCEIFSPNGGFVFNAVHNVQAKTPVENIAAMIDAVHEFNENH